jgi:electron transfer flavoprotein alpha subunit
LNEGDDSEKGWKPEFKTLKAGGLPLTEPRGICILAELNSKRLPSSLTLELMGLGGKLASGLGENLCVVLLGNGISAAADDLARYGVEEVFYADHVRLSEYNPDIYLPVLLRLHEMVNPRIILSGHTSMGQDLLPRLAFSLQAGLITDCVGVDVGPDSDLLFTKPIYGGNALATLRAMSGTALATLRARVGEVPPPGGQKGKVTPLEMNIPDQPAIELKGKHLGDRECALEDAPVVVTGGRGMGGEEGFVELQELADLLGGAVGASRPPVDSGWADSTRQVGITGKVVAPDIYIAVAISGSTQHLSGMSESGKIVAINKDPEAFIFKVSDYGVVGDWRQVLHAFTDKIGDLISE